MEMHLALRDVSCESVDVGHVFTIRTPVSILIPRAGLLGVERRMWRLLERAVSMYVRWMPLWWCMMSGIAEKVRWIRISTFTPEENDPEVDVDAQMHVSTTPYLSLWKPRVNLELTLASPELAKPFPSEIAWGCPPSSPHFICSLLTLFITPSFTNISQPSPSTMC